MQFSELQTALKNLCTISGVGEDTFLKQSINDGQADFSRDINWAFLENRGSITSVASKYIYDLASDFDTIKAVIFERNHILIPINWGQWIELNTSTSTGTPRYFIIKEGKLHLYPATGSAAATTTLGAAITSASDTTITLTSVSNLEGKGRALIDSEVIEWQAISGSTIINCRRGLEGTTAATHLNGAAFTYRNIEYDYYKTLADMSDDADTSSIPTRYHEALILYAASRWYEKLGETGLATYFFGRYNFIKQQAKADLGEKQSQRFTTTLDDSSPRVSWKDNTYPENGSLTAAS